MVKWLSIPCKEIELCVWTEGVHVAERGKGKESRRSQRVGQWTSNCPYPDQGYHPERNALLFAAKQLPHGSQQH